MTDEIAPSVSAEAALKSLQGDAEDKKTFCEIGYSMILHNGEIYSISDAREFLGRADLGKDNIIRLLCWLITLKIIPDSCLQSAYGVATLYFRYKELVKSRLSDPENPLSDISKKEARVIIADIDRSIFWFKMLIEKTNIDQNYTVNTKLHAHRILALLSLSKSDSLSYIQGFDRYVLLCYTLSLNFTYKANLGADVAEGIAYFLSYLLILMAKPGKYLADNNQTISYFKNLDKKMFKWLPEMGSRMNDIGITSMLFALRWHLLIFADEHDLNGILYIWDNVILHQDCFNDYLCDLSIAHTAQIPQENEMNLVELIQHYKDWEDIEIVRKADELLLKQKQEGISHRNKISLMITIIMILIIIIYLLYYSNLLL